MVQTPEMRIAPDPVADRDAQARLHADAADRRDRRPALRHQPRARRTNMRCRSQQRTAAAQAAGRFDAEIVPVTTTMMVKDKETGEVSQKEVTIAKDEGNRADTTLEGLVGPQPGARPRHHRSPPAMPASCPTAARPAILMEAKEAETPRASRRWPLRRHGGRRHRARRDGHRPDRSRCPSCSSASTSRSTTSACGN